MRAACLAMLLGAELVAGGGCGPSSPRLTAAQREAIETRRIDASTDEVLNAAATAMLDQGLLFSLSDPEAGLLGASRHIGADAMECAGCGGMASSGVLLWVRAAGPRRSDVRVHVTEDGVDRVDEQSVTRVVAAIERRLPGAAAGPLSAGGAR